MTDVPRIELHLHLEGAAPPDFIRRIAAEKSHRLDRVFDERGGYDFSDFTRFLQVYDAATAVLTTPDDYARLVTAICEDLAEQGVIYAETFVSPEFCGGNDLTAWRDYLAAMTEAAARAEARHGLRLRGVVTPIRHLGPERAKGAALCAAETAGAWVVGLGIGGEDGIVHVLRSLLAETDLIMAVDGYPTLADLTPDTLRRVT